MFQDETRHDENKMQNQQQYQPNDDMRDGKGKKRKSETKLLDAVEVFFSVVLRSLYNDKQIP